jgi:5-methylcytosine-specific restriction endonuclease McrA
MGHHINETELINRKVTKHRFRKSIIEEWDSCCYICGEKFNYITLDHLVPKKSGGYTCKSNLAPCCSVHNGQKGHSELWAWWTRHETWNLDRAIKLISYLRRIDNIPLTDDKKPMPANSDNAP